MRRLGRWPSVQLPAGIGGSRRYTGISPEYKRSSLSLMVLMAATAPTHRTR
jgi:hypothetical protein